MSSNLLANLPRELPAEVFETLLSGGSFRLERILSLGQSTPPGDWLSQAEAEWVLLLAGAAKLEFVDPPENLALLPGDFVLIESQRRHRVAWTDPTRTTVWLALHFLPAPAQDTAVH